MKTVNLNFIEAMDAALSGYPVMTKGDGIEMFYDGLLKIKTPSSLVKSRVSTREVISKDFNWLQTRTFYLAKDDATWNSKF